MRNHYTYLLLMGVFIILNGGCYDQHKHEKFQRPDWLPGKLYTTVASRDNLTIFTECLQLTGLDTILDVSGVWSVFAPNDDAMIQYLYQHQYTSVADIPLEELERLTKFHIVQNPWSFEQLQSLSSSGWRKENDEGSNAYAYKRETILKNSIEKYWVKRENKKQGIVLDSANADGYKKVFVQSRKYVPIFYSGYFDENNITPDDYNFYFGRDYTCGNVHFAGAKIVEADFFAENGFLHVIDKVVEPMKNAKEILESERPGESYKLFLSMINWHYSEFDANMTATYSQPSVQAGGLVDTLWDLDYSSPVFTLQGERIGSGNPNSNETLVSHYGLYAPTDNAFRKFVDGILTTKSGFPHWSSYRSVPSDVLQIIFEPHFSDSPLYPSKWVYNKIFRKIGDRRIEKESVVRKEFGSNCTFVGVDDYIPDQVFTSVTGPVFLRPNFSVFRRALLYANIDDDISQHDGPLYFFPIPNDALLPDSSLILNWINKDANQYNFSEYNRETMRMEGLGRNTIRNRIMNHVGTIVSNENNKTTIRTLRGSYIVWDRTNNSIRGSRPSTIGYTGDVAVTNYVTRLEEPADNGEVYSVNYWIK